MSNQDKLIIAIRLMGIYFLWQTFQALLLVLSMTFVIPEPSPVSSLLDVFSGGPTNSIYLLHGGLTSLVQGTFSLLFLLKARKIAMWLTHDISTKPTTISLNKSDTVTMSIQIIGLVIFVITVKDMFRSLSSLVFIVEQPLTSPIFVLLVLQILFSLAFILRAQVITKFIQHFGK